MRLHQFLPFYSLDNAFFHSQVTVGGLFDAILLQRSVNDGRAEEEDQRASSRVFTAPEPEPVDRHIRVPSRDHRGRGSLRVVQPVRIESLRQAEIQEFRVSLSIFFQTASCNFV